MNKAGQTTQPATRALWHYGLFVSLYVLLIFILPANSTTLATYNLSAIQYHFLLLLIVSPSLAIWLAAFIGYSKLGQYAYSIKKTPEGIHFDQLARGCAWLAWSLPLTAIVPLIFDAFANRWSDFHPTAIIVSNYLNLILPLIAFSIIASASRGLLSSNPEIKFDQKSAQLIVVGFLAAGALYCLLTFRRFDLSSLASTHNPYFLPIWIMIVTITVPYLYAWFIGTLAAYELTLFTKRARGLLYRQALRFVIGGLVAVILSSIALQYLNSIVPRIGYLTLDYRLLMTTFFRIVGGAGFILLAVGAIRLKKIEEI